MSSLDPTADEVVRLRRCLNDLIGITALPALWASGGPRQIANVLADALLSTLPLVFAFVRIEDPLGGTAAEIIRLAGPLAGTVEPVEMAAALDKVPPGARLGTRISLRGIDLSVACARLGIEGEFGTVLVGSRRDSFPEQTDRLLLDVAANQAAMGLQQVRLLNEQRRVSRELDERVAQRSSQLADAQEQLKRSEYYWRLIVDNIPGMVALLSAVGAVEVVNRQLSEYFGQTLEELRDWGTSGVVHADDLPHVAEVFMRSIAAGSPYEIQQRFRRSDGVYRWFTNSGFPLRDSDGTILRWCVLLTDVDERKRAEEALRRTETELRRIIDTIPALAWCNLPDGPNEFLSASWHQYTGLSPEEAHGWGWQTTFHPDDLPPLMQKWVAMLTSGEPGEIEARIRRHDGVYRWFLIQARPFRDDSGQIVRWYGTSTDIEDRKRAEQALESRGHDLKLIIDTIPTLSWSTEANGSVDFLSRGWLDYTGLTMEQARGFGWSIAVHPDDAEGLLHYWQGALESGALVDVEARLRRFDGAYRWLLFRANPLRDENGNIIKWYGTNIDIEDRKRAEEELRRKEAFLAKAQSLSLTGSFSLRVDTEKVTFSDEAYRIYGFDLGTEVTLDRIAARVHPEDRPLFTEKAGGAKAGADQTYSLRLQMPNGSVRYLRSSGQSTVDETGRPEYLGAVQDVTAQHLAEESLAKARSELAHVSRVSSFSVLAASIAHEISQPLSGIITNASTCLRMLDAESPNVEGARETARRTLRDGSRVADVISRLRVLFSKREFTLESMNLNDATRDVLAMLSTEIRQLRIVLQIELTGAAGVITGDRVQLQQVILNLVRNSLEAMADVRDRPRRLVIRTESEQNGYVRLSVRDSGVGLDGQNLEQLFDSFYTTKSGGMGIGLSVSRSIIEKHNGRLWAEPNDGPGATFAFSIPVRPEIASLLAPESRTT